MMNLFYLFLGIIFETFSATLVKYSNGFTKIYPTIGLLVGYGISLFLFSLAVKTIPVPIAYSIWAGGGIILTTIISRNLFEHEISIEQIFGMLLIVLGIVLVQNFQKHP